MSEAADDRTVPASFSVGIVGAGQIVDKVHLPVLKNVPGARVTWLTDRDSRRAASVARAYGVRFAELPSRLEELPPADVVLLAVPFGARPPYYDALRGRDTALFVEKPLFLTEEEHRRVCSDYAPHRIAHGFQRRCLGATRLVRELVGREVLGPLRRIRFEMGDPGVITHGRYYSDLKLAGGGILFETGVHGIDTLLHVSAATHVDVKEARMILEAGFDLDAEAELILGRDDADPIEASIATSCLRETANSLDLVFDRAVVSYSIFDESGAVYLSDRERRSRVRLAPEDPRRYPRTSFQVAYQHWCAFLDGLRAGIANESSAHDAILTTQVVEGCYARGGAGQRSC